MPGVKRKHSSAFPASSPPTKMMKHSSSCTVSRALSVLRKKITTKPPLEMPKIPALIPPSKKETLTSSPSLRREPTLTIEEESHAAGADAVDKEIETTMTKLKSGSSIVEMKVLSSKPSLTKDSSSKISLAKKESITDVLTKAKTVRFDDDATAGISGKAPSLSKKASTKGSVTGGGDSPSLKKKSSSKSSSHGAEKAPSLTKKLSSKNSVAEEESSGVTTGAAWLPPGGLMEIVFSFDTTGSMYSCLDEVRGKINDMIQRLQADIPGIRIAVIAHGDYCDASNYVIKWVDFGSTLPELCDFVSNVSRTSGGDGDECYELVLKSAAEALSWTPGSQRSLVMIGDSNPHEPSYSFASYGAFEKLDWRDELKKCCDNAIKIYAVQARSFGGNVDVFYKRLAKESHGRHIKLDNFTVLFDMMMAICYREKGAEFFDAYEDEVREREGVKIGHGGLTSMFDALRDGPSTSKTAATSAKPPPAAFGLGFTGFGTFATPIAKKGKAKPTKGKEPKAKPTKGKTVKAKPTKGKAAKAKPTKAKPKSPKKPVAKKKSKAKGGNKPAKAKMQKTKRSKVKKVVRVKRESVNEAAFMKGPLGNLEWSPLELGLVKQHYRIFKEWRPRVGTRSGWRNRDLYFMDTDRWALYEFSWSSLPHSKTKFPVFYKLTQGFTVHRIWDSYMLNGKKIAPKVEELINKAGNLHVRRGVFKARRIGQYRAVAKELNKYDYAWICYGKDRPGQRQLADPDSKLTV